MPTLPPTRSNEKYQIELGLPQSIARHHKRIHRVHDLINRNHTHHPVNAQSWSWESGQTVKPNRGLTKTYMPPTKLEHNMYSQRWRNHSAAYKVKVELAEMAGQLDVRPKQITEWKARLSERMAEVFVAERH